MSRLPPVSPEPQNCRLYRIVMRDEHRGRDARFDLWVDRWVISRAGVVGILVSHANHEMCRLAEGDENVRHGLRVVRVLERTSLDPEVWEERRFPVPPPFALMTENESPIAAVPVLRSWP